MNDELHQAVAEKNISKIQSLLDQGYDINGKDDFFGNTPLTIALNAHYMDVFNYLLKKGADPRVSTNEGFTCLHILLKKFSISAAENDAFKTILKNLLDKGLDINARNKDGRTALHVAATENRSAFVIATLIKHGAEVNAASNLGRTPLHESVARFACQSPATESVSALLKHHADPTIKDNQGDTALDLAVEYQQKGRLGYLELSYAAAKKYDEEFLAAEKLLTQAMKAKRTQDASPTTNHRKFNHFQPKSDANVVSLGNGNTYHPERTLSSRT